MKIPVIDLFAGPGGLSEGFSSYRDGSIFKTDLSIEKDEWAHRTLELRSFVRQFPAADLPDEYYKYIRGEGISKTDLFNAYPDEGETAERIAWHAELGVTPLPTVLKRVRKTIRASKHWVLLGGPPCQAYSTIGRARRTNDLNFENDTKHTLYREYLKIVAASRPTVFVMENVKGILSAKFQGEKIFPKILSDLRNPLVALSDDDKTDIPNSRRALRYAIYSFTVPVTGEEWLKPDDYLIESENYGVPQNRHRVILLGIRIDYDEPPHPVLETINSPFTVRDVLFGMSPIRSRASKDDKSISDWKRRVETCLANKVLKTKEFKAVYDRMLSAVNDIESVVGEGKSYVSNSTIPSELATWLCDKRLGGHIQHLSKAHMDSDLWRYLFASSYTEVMGTAPKIEQFPDFLWPNHKNAKLNDSGRVKDFRDRFKVQIWDQPSSTVTAHIKKDGHYYIHPDPTQCRSLTVREAARLQTFPDNYFFEGPQTMQYEQIGNAVPPYLAYQMADVVYEIIQNCWSKDEVHHMQVSDIEMAEA